MYSRKAFLAIGFLFIFFLMNTPEASAQCAMCRASVESNVSDGGIGIGAGLNRGILYLMLAPYVLLSAIGYAWYRHSKSYTEKQRELAQALKRVG